MRKLEAGSEEHAVKFEYVGQGPLGGLLGDAIFLDLQQRWLPYNKSDLGTGKCGRVGEQLRRHHTLAEDLLTAYGGKRAVIFL